MSSASSTDIESSTVIDKQLLRQIIEGALLAVGQPLTRDRLMDLFVDDDIQPDKANIQAALEEIQASCEGRGFELNDVGSGWRFQVREAIAPWINRLWDEKPQKYSRALLETLSLIAYRQPITRGDIEEIRGVAVSSHIIKTLVEREWVKVVGHRDVPGRPSLFATTRQFLDYFNLKSLEELPSLGEIRDLEDLNKELDLEVEMALGIPETDSSNELIEPVEEDVSADITGSKPDTDELDTDELDIDELDTDELDIDELDTDEGEVGEKAEEEERIPLFPPSTAPSVFD